MLQHRVVNFNTRLSTANASRAPRTQTPVASCDTMLDDAIPFRGSGTKAPSERFSRQDWRGSCITRLRHRLMEAAARAADGAEVWGDSMRHASTRFSLFLLLVGCAAGSPAEAPAAQHFATSADACAAWTAAWCDWASACGDTTAHATCLKTAWSGMLRQSCLTSTAPIWAARDSGHVTVDDGVLARCFAAAGGACGLAPQLQQCLATAISGELQAGAACSVDGECTAAAYCAKASPGACAGTCKARGKVDEACSSPSDCAGGLLCGNSGKCSVPPKAGDACLAFLGCGDSLVCDGTCKPVKDVLAACKAKTGAPCGWTGNAACIASMSSTGGLQSQVCHQEITAFGAEGAACSLSWPQDLPDNAANFIADCRMGLQCGTGAGSGSRKCMSPLGLGAACDTAPDGCAPGAFCDPKTSHCAAQPGQGDACASMSIPYCAAPFVCGANQICVVPKENGAACAGDADCVSGHCVAGTCAATCG